MNEDLIKLIHNECTPEERLATMRRIESDSDFALEYREALKLDDELRAMFSDAAGASICLEKPEAPRIAVFAKFTAGFAALAASVALLLVVSKAPEGIPSQAPSKAQEHIAQTPSTNTDPFADRRHYTAQTRHELTPAEKALAMQLSSTNFADTLEIQSRATAKAKIKEIVSAPYIPKVGKDLKFQTTTQEAIEMLLADKNENADSFLGFAPNIY